MSTAATATTASIQETVTHFIDDPSAFIDHHGNFYYNYGNKYYRVKRSKYPRITQLRHDLATELQDAESDYIFKKNRAALSTEELSVDTLNEHYKSCTECENLEQQVNTLDLIISYDPSDTDRYKITRDQIMQIKQDLSEIIQTKNRL